MQAILVRYLPTTNNRPTRLVATAPRDGKTPRLVESLDSLTAQANNLPGQSPHEVIAYKLCRSLGWGFMIPNLVAGDLKGDKIFVYSPYEHNPGAR